MSLKNDVPHTDMSMWGTPILRCLLLIASDEQEYHGEQYQSQVYELGLEVLFVEHHGSKKEYADEDDAPSFATP